MKSRALQSPGTGSGSLREPPLRFASRPPTALGIARRGPGREVFCEVAGPCQEGLLVTIAPGVGTRLLVSARFFTLLFALDKGDAGSPAHGVVRWVRGAISETALGGGQDLARAHRTRTWEPAE